MDEEEEEEKKKKKKKMEEKKKDCGVILTQFRLIFFSKALKVLNDRLVSY